MSLAHLELQQPSLQEPFIFQQQQKLLKISHFVKKKNLSVDFLPFAL